MSLKPPTGIRPEYIWREERICELADAIHRYVIVGAYSGKQGHSVAMWARELADQINALADTPEIDPPEGEIEQDV